MKPESGKSAALKPFQVIFLFFLTFYFCQNLLCAQWKKISGEHFIIYYAQNDEFARELLHKAESYYRKIASDLGYARYSKFWTWDNRVNIYVYPTQEEYLAATGQ
ncbi:MAG: hypothetical protein JW788_01845, partial [Candidatus Omnitrophica bacterium]|nr:hypothetical protein [Candidatus Omnitrophota bacterium]